MVRAATRAVTIMPVDVEGGKGGWIISDVSRTEWETREVRWSSSSTLRDESEESSGVVDQNLADRLFRDTGESQFGDELH